jgi:hypothetical protein
MPHSKAWARQGSRDLKAFRKYHNAGPARFFAEILGVQDESLLQAEGQRGFSRNADLFTTGE